MTWNSHDKQCISSKIVKLVVCRWYKLYSAEPLTRLVTAFLVRFSFEWRKVIGFALTTLRDWLKKKLRHFFFQSEVKPNSNATRLHAFSPRFTSATCSYLEFWLVHCIFCVLCDRPESLLWFWFYDTRVKTALTLCTCQTSLRPYCEVDKIKWELISEKYKTRILFTDITYIVLVFNTCSWIIQHV